MSAVVFTTFDQGETAGRIAVNFKLVRYISEDPDNTDVTTIHFDAEHVVTVNAKFPAIVSALENFS